MNSFDHQFNNELIKQHKKTVRKLNKQIKETNHSISFFTANKFDDIPASYILELKGKLVTLTNQLEFYKSFITNLEQLPQLMEAN